VTAVLSS
jgi:hypothetical protein